MIHGDLIRYSVLKILAGQISLQSVIAGTNGTHPVRYGCVIRNSAPWVDVGINRKWYLWNDDWFRYNSILGPVK